MSKRYHIIAHGSNEHPNLDEEVESIPYGLLSKYPFVSIQRIKPVPLDAVAEAAK